MVIEAGHFCAILALCLYAVAAIPGKSSAPLSPVLTAGLQLVFLTAAMASLTSAYVLSDFSVLNVFQNSHSLKPLLYKWSGVWGNHEGSILFWLWIFSVYNFLFVLSCNRNPALQKAVFAIQSAIGFGFCAYLLLTSNPFLRLDPAPIDGLDLNPVLQDPGLTFHPPLLYAGYVGLSLPFSIALALLRRPALADQATQQMRAWTALAWGFLTCGITLGSYWAYYELGWGGFWFWDPVENASLLPWLSATALLHGLMVYAKRKTLLASSVFLALLSFSLCLLGVFLVRSGVLTSVHAFANDPSRGMFLLLISAACWGIGFAYMAMRIGPLRRDFAAMPLSRESAILWNNLLLLVLCATVILGTLYPLILEALGLGRMSVGAPYYERVFIPIALMMFAAMGMAGSLSWGQSASKRLVRDFIKLCCATIFLCTLIYVFAQNRPWQGLTGIGAGIWILLGSLFPVLRTLKAQPAAQGLIEKMRRISSGQYNMLLAHAGIGILTIGISASVFWQSEITARVTVKNGFNIAGYSITLQNLHQSARENYGFVRAEILLQNEKGDSFLLFPEKRYYPIADAATTETGRNTDLWRDVYSSIHDIDKEGKSAVIYLSIRPLAVWIWIGGIVIGLSGFLASARVFYDIRKTDGPAPASYTDIRLDMVSIISFIVAAGLIYAALGSPGYLLY